MKRKDLTESVAIISNWIGFIYKQEFDILQKLLTAKFARSFRIIRTISFKHNLCDLWM